MLRSTVSLFLLLVSCVGASAEMVSGIAAVVNDEVITTRDVTGELAQLRAAGGPESARTRRDALTSLIDKRLLAQKIKEANIKISDEEITHAIDEVKTQNHLSQEQLVSALASQGIKFETYRTQIREQLEKVRLVSQEVRAKVQITQEEISRYYASNPGEFSVPEKVRISHIFFRSPKTEGEVARASARALADETLAELKGGADFAAVAARKSDDPSGKQGGSLGVLGPADLHPEFQKALAGAKQGDISSVFETAAGFHIVKVDERIPGTAKPLDDVRGQIEEKLYRGRMDERFQHWLDELKQGAVIEVIRPS